MNSLPLSDYLLLLIEYFILTIDLLINIFADYLSYSLISQLAIYIAQDFAQIIGLIILSLLFFKSSVLESGLFKIILKKYSSSLCVALIYLILTISLQIKLISINWNGIKDDQNITTKWPQSRSMLTLFIAHRAFSAFYYFLYRNASSRLHDPSLIHNLITINNQQSSSGQKGHENGIFNNGNA